MDTKDVPAPAPALGSVDRCAAMGISMRGDRNQNPPGMSLLALLKEDLRTHESVFAHGFLAVAVNRFGNWRMGLPRLLRPPFRLLYEVALRWTLWMARIELPYITKVGRRVRLWHHGGSVLGAMCFGDDVQIRHNVTIGLANHGDDLGQLPIIEDRVIIGAGAVILGPITVGHDSIVAANAVVTKDVPPFALVGGVPAKVLRQMEPTVRATQVNVRDSIERKAA